MPNLQPRGAFFKMKMDRKAGQNVKTGLSKDFLFTICINVYSSLYIPLMSIYSIWQGSFGQREWTSSSYPSQTLQFLVCRPQSPLKNPKIWMLSSPIQDLWSLEAGTFLKKLVCFLLLMNLVWVNIRGEGIDLANISWTNIL